MIRNIAKTMMLGLVLGIPAVSAYANDGSKEEGTGAGIGVVIGGVAGGPVGAILGAAFGAKIGDAFHQRGEQVDSLSASLKGSREELADLQGDIAALEETLRSKDGELSELRELARPELLSLLAAGIEMDLLFRTDEYVLSESTGTRLQQLAGSLAANPDIRIRLDGYADERGDETYNQKLSLRRVEHVRDVLVGAGIPQARISGSAHGESPAAEPNLDNFALERRVSLTLYLGNAPSFAANPR